MTEKIKSRRPSPQASPEPLDPLREVINTIEHVPNCDMQYTGGQPDPDNCQRCALDQAFAESRVTALVGQTQKFRDYQEFIRWVWPATTFDSRFTLGQMIYALEVWVKFGVTVTIASPTQIAQPDSLTHTRSCPGLTPIRSDECNCGLQWRIQLRTEQEMRATWQKRAEEAEARELAAAQPSQVSAEQPLEILRQMFELVTDEILVRNIAHDANTRKYITDAARLVEVLKRAEVVLTTNPRADDEAFEVAGDLTHLADFLSGKFWHQWKGPDGVPNRPVDCMRDVFTWLREYRAALAATPPQPPICPHCRIEATGMNSNPDECLHKPKAEATLPQPHSDDWWWEIIDAAIGQWGGPQRQHFAEAISRIKDVFNKRIAGLDEFGKSLEAEATSAAVEGHCFKRGQIVRVDNPQFHGFGIVQHDTGEPHKRYVSVMIENGNVWAYEYETVQDAEAYASSSRATKSK